MIANLLLRRLPKQFWKVSNLMGIKYFENIFQNEMFIKLEISLQKRRFYLKMDF